MTPALPASRLPGGTTVEDRKGRVDREPIELLTRVDRDAFYAAFLCTAVGTIMLMAPSAFAAAAFRGVAAALPTPGRR